MLPRRFNELLTFFSGVVVFGQLGFGCVLFLSQLEFGCMVVFSQLVVVVDWSLPFPQMTQLKIKHNSYTKGQRWSDTRR